MSRGSGGGGLGHEGSRLQAVTAGAIAGLVSRFVIAPLDVVKIRLQLRSGPSVAPLRGAVLEARRIVVAEGVTALWKGNVPAELMYVGYAAVQFGTYRAASLAIASHSRPAAWHSFACGAIAGAVATSATYPLDLLRTRFAAQGAAGRPPAYASLRRAVVQVWRDEGGSGFFRGFGPTLAQIAPHMGILFATYEALRARLPQSADAASGLVAGVVAKAAVFPLDLMRKRMQVQGPTRAQYGNVPEYRNTVAGVVAIVRADGVRGLYRGLVVSLCKAVPASAVTLWTYEHTLRLLKSQAERQDQGD